MVKRSSAGFAIAVVLAPQYRGHRSVHRQGQDVNLFAEDT